MKLRISGKNPSIKNSELRYAAKFMASLLMSKRLVDNLYVHVKSVELKGFDGEVDPISYDELPLRSFKISLSNKLLRVNALETLAHELAHVRQYARGELREAMRGKMGTKWKKRTYSLKETEDKYWLMPWELEAFGYAVGLTQTYLNHLHATKKKFK